MMSRPGLGHDTSPDTGHGHWDNLGKLDSVIPIPWAVSYLVHWAAARPSIHHFVVFLIRIGAERLLHYVVWMF